MKWLAGLLVVLNAAVFIWGGWYKDAPETVRQPQPPLQADKMRLLSEPGVARSLRPARTVPAPAEAAPGAACFAIGPFADAAAAAKAGAQLDRRQWSYAVRAQPQRVPSAWQVLLPPPGSKAQAEAKRKELIRRGINEHYLILSGRNKGAISLGLFSTPEAAQKQLEHLHRLGVQAQIDVRYRRGEEFWLEGALPASATDAGWSELEALKWEAPQVRASRRACPAPTAEPTKTDAPIP